MSKALSRYFHTIRHLRPIQIYGRLWFRLYRPRADLRPAPPAAASEGRWRVPGLRASSMTGPAEFEFLAVRDRVAASGDWNAPRRDKLWLYNLHYFDDLAAEGAADRTAWHRALIERWIAENPPGQGNGWEPYPLSLRIVNWVKWALAGNGLEPGWRDSLAAQTRYLRRRLEHHLLGNHLWANAKALVFAGAYFDGAEADAWRAKGLALLRRELDEQILPDGGHFERSPMYHAILLEDLLDLLQLARLYPRAFAPDDAARWREATPRMLRWLQVMTHPDGDIAFFNDAALGIAPSYPALAGYARDLGIPDDSAPPAALERLADSGYVRLQAGPAVLIADVAGLGPDYLPGHAHADTLSFELSLHGRRLLVNGGTSTYESGAERRRQRGTAMHNTVEIDGDDSSEVWGSFRVARRARPFGIEAGVEGGEVWLRGAHDGYRRLSGRPVHRREWRLDVHGLQVADSIEGRFGMAVARYRFHPSVQLRQTGPAAGVLVLPEGRRVEWRVTGAEAAVVASSYHPRFGRSEPCQCLELRFQSRRSELRLNWR